MAPRHTSTFSVLQATRSSRDAVPPWAARHLLEEDEPRLSKTDLRDARRVLPNQQGWLVPAPGGKLCLARLVYPLVPRSHGKPVPPIVNRACSGEAEASMGRLMETQSLSTTFASRLPTRVDGIVPDGVHHVVINSSVDGTKTVSVARNAYELIVVNPRSVSFVTDLPGHRQRYIVQTPTVVGAKPYPSPSH
jgi:hypothetical protein